MALFKRRESRESVPARGVADEALPFMSSVEADRFRTLVGSVFADVGVPVTVLPDRAVDAKNREFGFWNIATQCAEAKPGKWRDLIDHHVRRVLESVDAPSPFEGLDREEAHYRTYVRLYEEAFIQPPHRDEYPHREFAPGIVEMLALDLPDSVAVYDHGNAQALGGFAALRDSGIANLEQLAVERLETLQTPGESVFYALLGDSVYTGSRALLLPGLATSLTGEQPTEHGWLMSIPNRHQVTWHFVKDASVVQVINSMCHFTHLGYGDAPGPVSPHLYWWNGTEYERLTHIAEDGTFSVRPSPRFQAVLETLFEGK
jgi:hypothetical protein